MTRPIGPSFCIESASGKHADFEDSGWCRWCSAQIEKRGDVWQEVPAQTGTVQSEAPKPYTREELDALERGIWPALAPTATGIKPDALRRLLATARAGLADSERAWVVVVGFPNDGPLRYLNQLLRFSVDASAAIRFSREQDAAGLIATARGRLARERRRGQSERPYEVRVEEHIWTDNGRAQPNTQPAREESTR